MGWNRAISKRKSIPCSNFSRCIHIGMPALVPTRRECGNACCLSPRSWTIPTSLFLTNRSGLDVTSALIFKNLVQALGQQGKLVFYCSHVLEVVEKVCSDVLILRKGVVLAQDSVANIGQILGQSLENTFLHLVDDVDTMSVARDIVTAMKMKAA